MTVGDWWVDVAVEVYAPGYTLQWLTAKHSTIRHWLLSSAQSVDIPAHTRHYTDYAANTFDLAGFRLATGTIGNPDGICYIQAYTTDKSATYQLHTGSFRRHRGKDLLPAMRLKLLQDLQRIENLFSTLNGSDDAGSLDVFVRKVAYYYPGVEIIFATFHPKVCSRLLQ